MSGEHFVGKEVVKEEPIDFHKIISVLLLLSVKLAYG